MWKAQITVNGKYEYLGYYESEEEAARAYDRRALTVLGRNAQLNFPIDDYRAELQRGMFLLLYGRNRLSASTPEAISSAARPQQEGMMSGQPPTLGGRQAAILNSMSSNLMNHPMAHPFPANTGQRGGAPMANLNMWQSSLAPPYFQHYQSQYSAPHAQRVSQTPEQTTGSPSHGSRGVYQQYQLNNPFMNLASLNSGSVVSQQPDLLSAEHQGMQSQMPHPHQQPPSPYAASPQSALQGQPQVSHQSHLAADPGLPPEKVTSLMNQLGITPVQLAQELGINLSHFLGWLENTSSPQYNSVGVLVAEWYDSKKDAVNNKLVDIRSKIKSLMLYIGVTQLQVAKELGLHASTVSEW